jgi:DNA polymerase III epsilon subunit-like protein
MNVMILDVETSGLPIVKRFNVYHNPKNLQYYESSRLVELGYSMYTLDKEKLRDITTLIIPDNFTITNHAIHGITHENAKTNGVLISKAFSKLEKDMDKIGTIVGHNIMFDITIIISECYRYGFSTLIDKILTKQLICTMKLGKQYLKLFRNPSLLVLHRTLFKKYVVQTHRALDDVNLCAECYFYMT